MGTGPITEGSDARPVVPLGRVCTKGREKDNLLEFKVTKIHQNPEAPTGFNTLKVRLRFGEICI
jgi:hypothetical protein